MRKHYPKKGGLLNVMEKGETLNPNGRPRKLATTLKHEGYKKLEIQQTVDKLSALTKKELGDFEKSKDATALEIGVIKMLKNFMSKGKSEILDYLICKKMASEGVLTIENKRELTKDETIAELVKKGYPSKIFTDDEVT